MKSKHDPRHMKEPYSEWRIKEMLRKYPGGKIHWTYMWPELRQYAPETLRNGNSAIKCIEYVLNEHIPGRYIFHEDDCYYFRTRADLNLVRLLFL